MTKIKERHGISGARNITKNEYDAARTQAVVVWDGESAEVCLWIGGANTPVGMTPEQAEFIGSLLFDAARRVRDDG